MKSNTSIVTKTRSQAKQEGTTTKIIIKKNFVSVFHWYNTSFCYTYSCLTLTYCRLVGCKERKRKKNIVYYYNAVLFLLYYTFNLLIIYISYSLSASPFNAKKHTNSQIQS